MTRPLQTSMERVLPAGTILVEGVCSKDVIPSDLNLAIAEGKVLVEEVTEKAGKGK